jgi:hypothetical protein
MISGRGAAMPIHDWTRVSAALFQSFRSAWVVAIDRALNGGALPPGYYALLAPAAVSAAEVVADPGTVPFREPWRETPAADDMEFYRLKKSHIVVRRSSDHTAVAVVDVVSAGDRATAASVRAITDRLTGVLRHGVNVLLCDVLPPGPHDPHGLHSSIWAEVTDSDFALVADKPLAVMAYAAAPAVTAGVETLAVGDVLPDMPLALTPREHAFVALEAAYQAAWGGEPAFVRELLDSASVR